MSVGIDILHSSQEIKWMDIRIPFRNRNTYFDPFDLHTSCLDALSADMEDLERPSIIDAQYQAIDPKTIAKNQ